MCLILSHVTVYPRKQCALYCLMSQYIPTNNVSYKCLMSQSIHANNVSYVVFVTVYPRKQCVLCCLCHRSIHASNVHELVDRIGSLQLISEGKPLTRATHSAQRPRDRGGANDTADTEAAHPQDVSPMSCHAPGTTTDTSHCPHDPQGGSTVHTPATGETSGLRHRYDDLLEGAMPRHTPRHECAKMLSLTDVLSLQREQQRTHAVGSSFIHSFFTHLIHLAKIPSHHC